MKVTLKKANHSHADFFKKIFFQFKTTELNAQQWPDHVILPILENQYAAQEISYKIHFPDAEKYIMMLNEESVGMIMLNMGSTLHIINMIVDNRYRGQNIGTTVLNDMIDHAKSKNKQITLKVDRNNPALRLYKRLGFEIIKEDEVYISMIAG